MKKILIILVVLVSSNISWSKENSAIVLMYHRFEDKRFPSTSISIENFKKQINYLVQENFNILPISKLIPFFYGDFRLPDKSIFITIDDGYKSFYENGFPILPFSVFVSPGYVSETKESDFMSWSTLKKLLKNNGEILNHTESHARLLEMSTDEIKNEFISAKEKIKFNLGEDFKIVSYPYGESNKSIEDIVMKMGYKLGFSQHSSPIHYNENKFNLPRFAINDEFGNIKRFKQIVNSKPLIFSNLKILDKDSKLGVLKIQFESISKAQSINCYINNSATINKKNHEKIIELKFSNLIPGNSYRLNCTYFNENRELFWNGKIIRITEESIRLY
jgi:peptidoglycan/xylan/chitin deacetylase (PgdA/CDA1 family)